jgi:hypothetical protein
MAPARKKTSFAIDDCVMVDAKVVAPGHHMFVAHSAAVLKTKKYVCRVLEYQDGDWTLLAEWPWQAVALDFSSTNPLQVEVLGRDGQVGTVTATGSSVTQLDPPRPVGPFRGMRNTPYGLLAFGMKREVFRRDRSGAWARMMQGLDQSPDRKLSIKEQIRAGIANVGGINAIEVAGAETLFAFGMKGEIWRYEAAKWVKLESPTNLILTDATTGPDRNIFVCGQSGTLLNGAGDRWGVFKYDGPPRLDFVSIDSFKGLLFIADGHSLRVLEDGELKLVDFGTEEIVPCAVVTAGPGCVLSVAGQEVWESTNGRAWNSILG